MKRLSVVLAVLAFVALGSLAASAQGGRLPIRGKIIGTDGKPLVGADVLWVGKDNGLRFNAKSDKKGEYINIGVALGKYHMTVSVDGKVVWERDMVATGEEMVIPVDLPKEQQEAQQEALRQLTPEQRKQMEQQQKALEQEKSKVANLNQALAQARAAQDAGNFEQAIAILKPVTEPDTTHDLLWSRLAELYLSQAGKLAATDKAAAADDYNLAVDAYKKAIAIKGSVPGYHNNLGQAYAKLGNTDQAIAEYNTAAQLSPQDAGMFYYNLGAILTNAGKIDEANAAFDKAIAADPNKADAYYWKGVNLMGKATIGKDGKMVAPPEAAQSLNKYLELQPDGPHAQTAKEMLAYMGAKVETSFSKSGAKKK